MTRGMRGRNRLKLGIFGSNCSSGLAKTKVPERWSGSYADNLALARMIDAAGIEFLLPIGRWKGYDGETNPQGETFETVTWATGMLSGTRDLTVFGTVHVPLIHPLFAAKMCVTADHAGTGRFALNIVCGSHQQEFDMFGEPLRENEPAYAYGREWFDIVSRLWTDDAPFDHDGEFFHLKNAQALPKPWGGSRPLIMNAGQSAAGKDFGLRYADDFFTLCDTLERAAKNVREIQAGATTYGREIGVYTSFSVVCRPTKREAEDYYRYFASEMADWDALDGRVTELQGRARLERDLTSDARLRQIAGYGAHTCIGDADGVARELADYSAAGLTGIGMNFVNYLDEFPYFRDEVLPRLERLGVRESR